MPKLKLMTIVGTRPEIIRLSEVIKACDIYFEHTLVHTGQNWDYTLNQVMFEDLQLRQPDYFLSCAGETLGKTLGNILEKSYDILNKIMPDALLVLGDTNSALSAIVAKRLKIPIFHMEAGNRCFDQNVPEEINRKIIDDISDINLAYTEHSRRYLIAEGNKPDSVFVTGSPLMEVVSKNYSGIRNSKILEQLNIESEKYILVSAHREENIDNPDKFFSLMKAINMIANNYQLPVIYSVHPRSKKFIEERKFEFHPLVQLHDPFGYLDYNKLQENSFCVLSDSGTLSEESCILEFPGILIRNSTERPEVLDKSGIILGGTDYNSIEQSIEVAVKLKKSNQKYFLPNDYIDTNVSIKVVKIIQSCTKLVNEFVWRKPKLE